ncbi:methionine--tRNA ligase, cytoplasmic-like [Biomphalaria glabrata]|uniref:Methionine--tRNA ligase, cytoplasmic n=1 Tax=Biomphalaria glabrata TaxID=6526 RepID=A0A9W2YE01_BIOGL|nr:methionine--tRNA ligase, cytoplasmic-like [Biomphalaria glabrata]
MKLYSDKGNFQTLKISIAARLTGTASEILAIEVGHNDIVAPFLSKSKLPVLEVAEGKYLFSANTAAKYLFLKAGQVKKEEAEDEILEWENNELLPLIATYLINIIGQGKKESSVSDSLLKTLHQLESKLTKTKYLLDDTLSICDVCVFSSIFPLFSLKNQEVLSKLPNTKRYCEDVKKIQAVQDAISELTGGAGPEVFKASLLSQRFPLLPSSIVDRQTSGAAVATPDASGDQIPEVKLSQADLESARTSWGKKPDDVEQPRPRIHPILPDPQRRNILVTSALPYVNNVPHLGNIIGCVLSADAFSRFARLRNYNVLYICGTDEYGTATETKAMEEGVTPREICDKYNKLHVQIYKWFNIDFDYFGRTTTDQQTEIAQDIFWKLYHNGYVLKDSVDQLKCTKCDKFLADRFVEGICPLCGFDDARGDQCDACGKLINAVELKSPKCKICKSSPVIQTSNHLFVDLPKLEPLLSSHLNGAFESGTWTNNAKMITNSWIRDGLKPRCISRDLKWGTPVPLEGYTDKVFYVWFDAPIGYISITANYTSEWKQWWKNPQQIEMYNFLGKDNVPFHSVIFPACLLGTNDGYSVVNHMVATEYLNYEDTKFSKSRNSGVFGDQAEVTGIQADIYRFYLLFVRPESQDTAFSWDDFLLKNNSELLNNLGNFINRALMFLHNNFKGIVQEMSVTDEDVELLAQITNQLKGYISNLEACRLRDGIRNILTISRLGNQYMQVTKPWVLSKGSPEEIKRAGSVIALCANVACLLSVLLQPYMPTTSAVIQQQLQAPASVNYIGGEFVPMLQPGHQIGQPSPLFQKLESATMSELKAKFAGKPEEKTKKPSKKGEKAQPSNNVVTTEDFSKLSISVANQGQKVRELKAAKADKSVIDKEVAYLLQLKKDLEAAQAAVPKKESQSLSAEQLAQAVSLQGQKVRELKAAKAEKSVIDKEVACLLQLKKDLESQKESQPAVAVVEQSTCVNSAGGDAGLIEKLTQAVAVQGNKVRDLKAAKADKSVIDAEVASLLKLKKELELAGGVTAAPATKNSSKKNMKK